MEHLVKDTHLESICSGIGGQPLRTLKIGRPVIETILYSVIILELNCTCPAVFDILVVFVIRIFL